MVENIFDSFADDRTTESRMLRVSNRINAVARKGINLFAFIALGVSSAFAGINPSPSTSIKNIPSFNVPIDSQSERKNVNVIVVAGHDSGLANSRFHYIRAADIGVQSGHFSVVYTTPKWVEDFCEADASGNEGKVLEVLMDALDVYELEGRWRNFSDVLDDLSVENRSSIALVGIARMSYVFRSEIPSWHRFSARVAQELATRGEDVHRTMSGLL